MTTHTYEGRLTEQKIVDAIGTGPTPKGIRAHVQGMIDLCADVSGNRRYETKKRNAIEGNAEFVYDHDHAEPALALLRVDRTLAPQTFVLED